MGKQETEGLWLCLSGATLTLVPNITPRHHHINPPMLLPWLLVFGIIGFITVKNCNFSPLLFLPFFLDFSWLMLRALQNLEPIYRSSWVFLQGLLYISANVSELLLFELTDFVDFCWAVTIWKLMRNLYFSEIHWVLTINWGILLVFNPAMWRKSIYLHSNALLMWEHNICCVW